MEAYEDLQRLAMTEYGEPEAVTVNQRAMIGLGPLRVALI